MTNDQKLAAIARGVAGSYNLAPRNGTAVEGALFQGVARRAHEIAVKRGYFYRSELFTDGGAPVFAGLLVTVDRETAVAGEPIRLEGAQQSAA